MTEETWRRHRCSTLGIWGSTKVEIPLGILKQAIAAQSRLAYCLKWDKSDAHMKGCGWVEPSTEPDKCKFAPVQKLCNCSCCLELILKIPIPFTELISTDSSAAWSVDRADTWLHSSVRNAASCSMFCFLHLDFSVKLLLKINYFGKCSWFQKNSLKRKKPSALMFSS